jgi:hypothetical protein
MAMGGSIRKVRGGYSKHSKIEGFEKIGEMKAVFESSIGREQPEHILIPQDLTKYIRTKLSCPNGNSLPFKNLKILLSWLVPS